MSKIIEFKPAKKRNVLHQIFSSKDIEIIKDSTVVNLEDVIDGEGLGNIIIDLALSDGGKATLCISEEGMVHFGVRNDKS
ncbi:MAG: hypothetical protein FH762_18100 [Firmicutes bacterium]|nr:hypothetical protein [Bacillota bacterium]